MPDIRSFFAPKNGTGGAAATPKPKATPAATTASSTKKAAPKRKKRVVEDSDDEEEDVEPAKHTLKKAAAKPVKKEKTPEPVNTSDYFASSGKNKVTRSVPVRGTRKAATKNAIVVDDDEEDGKDTVDQETFKKNDDDYEEDPVDMDLDDDDDDDDFKAMDDDLEDVKPTKRATRAPARPTPAKSNKPVVKITPKSPPKAPAKAPARKRKQATEDEDSEEEPPKKAAKAKASPAKKRAPAKKKEEPVENPEIKKIHDGITKLDEAPSVMAVDPNKKFNYREAMANTHEAEVPGARDPPVGAENCLVGLSFVFTGNLPTLSREAGQQLVKKYGGKVMSAPSKKTNYVVIGTDAGPKKVEIIKKFNLNMIGEDGFFELIEKLPANGGDGVAAQEVAAKKAAEEQKLKDQIAADIAAEKKKAAEAAKKAKAEGKPAPPPPTNAELWTVKHAPQNLTQICGNKGQVEKLQNWLRNWPKSLKANFQKRGADGSGGYRAVMIHGAPGIGKTTAAHLVAKLEGYDILEYNASDTRSKKLMEETMRGVLDNTSIMGYFAAGDKKVDPSKQKIVLIMDEVDGMSAGDRGGVGQLAAFCKKTSVPIICICNERRLPKMKPFDFVTMDLAFRRPDQNMIRSRVASIAFREGLKLSPQAIDQLAEGTHSDIRQIVNMLQTYKTTGDGMNYDESRDMAKAWEKHVVFKPWDIAAKMLGQEMFGRNSKKTLNDKLELYFNDHEFSYLMIQENYLRCRPEKAGGYSGREQKYRTLELFDKAAEAISDGDLADSLIHGTQQHWSLMPTHGMFSTVIPAFHIHGGMTERINFTSWLGNNSKQGKLARFIKEIQSHIRLRTSGDRHEVRQQYLPMFFTNLVRRLEREGKDSIQDIIDTMDEYFLTKDDWDAILELGVGPADMDTVKIETQTKSAFTRMYNQQSHPMPFMKASIVAATKAAKKEVPDIEDAIIESDVDDAADDDAAAKKAAEEEEDLTKDKYIKQPKKKAAPKKKSNTDGGAKKTTKKAPAKSRARTK